MFIETHKRFSITVRYEDLVSRSKECLISILNLLEEDCNDEILDTMIKEFCSPSRGQGLEDPKVNKISMIHSYSIGRWEKELSTEHIEIAPQYLRKWFIILEYE